MSIFDALYGRLSGIDSGIATVETTTAGHESRITALEGGGVYTHYTSSTTWTKPTNGTDGLPFQADELFTISVWNGGDGGAKGSVNHYDTAKGGRGGGCVTRRVRYADLPSSAAITVGAAGTAATSAGFGGTGGVSSFGSLVVGVSGVGAFYDETGARAAITPPGNGGDGALIATSGTNNVFAPSEWGGSGPFAAGGKPGFGSSGAGLNGSAGGNAPTDTPSGGAGGGGGSCGSATAGAGGAGGTPGGGGGGGGNNLGSAGNGAAGGAGAVGVTAPH